MQVSPIVEEGSPIHCINFKLTKRNPHDSIKGLQVQPNYAQVAFDCILFKKNLSHIASPCSQLVSLSLITISTPDIYKGNCKSKAKLKYVSDCRKLSYYYGLCSPDT